MRGSSLQNSGILVQEKSHEQNNVLIIGLEHFSHGFVGFIGFNALNYYTTILIMNLAYGNRIFFIPFLLLIVTPLALIIIGAINSYALKLIYHIRTSQHWASLLAQGVFVGLAGLFLSFFWTFLFVFLTFQLLHRPDTYASGQFMVVIFIYIPFILFIPTLGYAVKELSSYFTGIKSEENQKDEQRMDISPREGTN